MTVGYRVELSEAERSTLRALVAGGKRSARTVKRAQILLAAEAGQCEAAIAATVGVGTSTVNRTKVRFVEGNLEGVPGLRAPSPTLLLSDTRGPGRKAPMNPLSADARAPFTLPALAPFALPALALLLPRWLTTTNRITITTMNRVTRCERGNGCERTASVAISPELLQEKSRTLEGGRYRSHLPLGGRLCTRSSRGSAQ